MYDFPINKHGFIFMISSFKNIYIIENITQKKSHRNKKFRKR